MSDASSVLLVEKSEGVATLTLNRPGAMNALSRDLRRALTDAFAALASDRETRVVILTGAGRAFCAGLDLKELGTKGLGGEGGGGGGGGGSSATDAITALDPVRALARVPQPVIGAINGFAITGGFELALGCDLLIASTEARFADTHARVGILPGWGLSQRLSRAIGIYRAKELSLTGNYLEAARAYDWGLVSRVVSPAELLPTCLALARDMLSCEPDVLAGYKKVIDDGFATTFEQGMTLESERSRAHARSVTPEALEERRGRVQDRGRQQSQG
ncbi:MAG: enoyl-CoA hydratase [Deltaproteobacteria bacterium]|nr:enoyl-CoA hydratase [Deltaproteobacteria bacterium]